MARDSMNPWLDRISMGELEVTGLSPRSALGSRDWDGSDARPANPDNSALPATVPSQVEDDTDDFDFMVASY